MKLCTQGLYEEPRLKNMEIGQKEEREEDPVQHV